MNILRKLWEILNSNFVLLIFGFLLTTYVGSWLNKQYHDESWKSQAKFEIFKEQIAESKSFEKNLLMLANKRFNLLEQVYIQLSLDNLDSARKIWKESYYPTVRVWNEKIKANRNHASEIFGEEIELLLLDDNESNSSDPKSIHYRFRVAHRNVLFTLNCMKKDDPKLADNCNNIKHAERLKKSRKLLDKLGASIDNIALELRLSIISKHKKLIY